MMETTRDDFLEALGEWGRVFMRRSMHAFVAQAHLHRLSMSQLGALIHVHRMGSCGVGQIGADLGVTTAAVSQLLDRLVESGLVEREEDPSDRRSKVIELTDRGRQVVRGTTDARQQWFSELAARLSDRELADTTSALRTLSDHGRVAQEKQQ